MIHSLAPAGDFAPPAALWGAVRALGGISALGSSLAVFEALEEAFQARLGTKQMAFFSSGAAALSTLLSAAREQLGLQTVVIAGFTCPDVVLAALQAKCSVNLVDIDSQSMEPLPETLEVANPREVVLLSNLYGIPDQISPWADSYKLVVDDGCQAYLSRTSEGYVGARERTVGVLSFGRGKALSGAGGGVIVSPPSAPASIISIVDGARNKFSPSPTLLSPIVKAIMSWLLERPSLYWAPSLIPGLGLGEVRVGESVSVAGCSNGAALVMLAQLARSSEIAQGCVEVAKRWSLALDGLALTQPFLKRGFTFDGSVVPSRYPILLPTPDVREQVEKRMIDAGLGVNRSYGKAVNAFYPKLAAPEQLPGARSVASRLLTLPTHRYVSEMDVKRAVAIIKAALGGA